MNTEVTSIYWLTSDEVETLNNLVIGLIETDKNKILYRIQSELSVAKTREENSPLPSDYITSIMELPENSIPIRLSHTEVEFIKKYNLPINIMERLS